MYSICAQISAARTRAPVPGFTLGLCIPCGIQGHAKLSGTDGD